MLKKLLIGATILSYGTMAMAQTLHFGMVWRAVEQKDEVTLGTISKTYGTVDVENRRGQTPLCHAIDEEDYESYVLLLKYGANRSHPCVQRLSQEQRAEFNENLRDYFEDKGGVSVSTLLWEAGAFIGGAALIGFAAGGKGGSGSDSGDGNGAGGQGSVGTDDLPGKTLSAADFKSDAYNNSGFLNSIGAAEVWARFYKGDKDADGRLTKLYTNVKDVKVGVIDTGVEDRPAFKDKMKGFNYDYGPCNSKTSTGCWHYDAGTGRARLIDEAGKETISVSLDASDWTTFKNKYPDDYVWSENKNITTPKEEDKSSWHGTVVSGILGADWFKTENMKDGPLSFTPGVALNAQIIPVRYDIMSGLTDPIVSLVDSGAKVINASLGVPSTAVYNASIFTGSDWLSGMYAIGADLEGLAYLSQKQTTALVFSAGNEGKLEPTLNAGAGLLADVKTDNEEDSKTMKSLFGNLKDLMVSVVSVDSDNTISNFSNRCGSTKDYCIAAPGNGLEVVLESKRTDEGIWSTEYGKKEGLPLQGTSFAAPVVSGALAFIMGAYPNMTAAQAIDLIFSTATDLGDPGVDETYGHGLLNLNAATSPQGTMTVATADTINGNTVDLNNTRLKMPRTMRGVLAQMPSGFAAFDKYQRSFTMPTSSIVSMNETDGKNFQNALHRFMKFDSVKTIGDEEAPMRFSFSTATNTDSELGVGSMDVSWHLNNTSVRFYYMEDGAYGMGDYVDRTTVNPFMAMDNAYGFENAYRLNDKYAFSFGLASGDNALFKTNEDDMEDADRLSVFQGGATYTPNDKVSFGLVSGMMAEENAFMGLHGNGGFDMENTRTYYAGVTAQLKPIQNLTLTGAYYYGMTPSTRLNDFMQTGKLHSDAFSFDARYHFDDTQYVGMVLSSPLRVRSGYTDLTLPTGRDYYSDTVYNETHRLKMAPEAREWDTGVYGQFNLAENIRAKMQGLVRFNPEHQADVKPDYQVMFGLNWLFN